jgi:hypothetical protein
MKTTNALDVLMAVFWEMGGRYGYGKTIAGFAILAIALAIGFLCANPVMVLAFGVCILLLLVGIWVALSRPAKIHSEGEENKMSATLKRLFSDAKFDTALFDAVTGIVLLLVGKYDPTDAELIKQVFLLMQPVFASMIGALFVQEASFNAKIAVLQAQVNSLVAQSKAK